ncbi:1-phosphatidylinositol phosphodiesterase [Cladophialophora yegresii CBS 114405]|uniref:1-phosphatidylinositol phosphodiesterase n=1 Tax=Cladophialophora yegresii CBS 114405 TaxID=1182544 RepID=W9VTM3_9EURO|nr:1-phosphatidylinositol phosphodiesterase [Cladophialophora yegresii CBS 114405]EXJ58898.1 1-phosphatidylinositol phosphodiesterase [Cladophialophora yegresii CBS 114405]
MAPPVTIRNISNNPLTLVLVEHFDPPPDEGFQMQTVTTSLANITNGLGLTNTTTRKAVPQIHADAKPFATREVSIKLPPFTIVPTDIKAVINKPNERLRLTFQTEMGGKHQMYCPVPTEETASLVALAPNPKLRFTGIYLPNSSFVALFNTSHLDSWMKDLPDRTPLGLLSIPGTHNSPTHHQAPPSVRCQAVSPKEQLKNGVRFFDIRVQVPEPYDPHSDKLVLVHAVFPIALTGNKYFRDLYNTIVEFLKEHPSETLILSLKREGTGKGTDEQLSRILKNNYTNLQQWYTEPRVPTLGEVRGRIVLLRRFMLEEPLKHEWNGKGWGIDGHVWEDNTSGGSPGSLCPSGDICVQDFYQVMEKPSIEKKIAYAQEHLERSGCCAFRGQNVGSKKIPLYVNFLSASNFWNVGCWPEKIAAEVNPAIVAHLCQRHMIGEHGKVKDGDWSTGIVVTDWVGLGGDWDLVRCIVGMNAKLIGN